MPIYVKDSIRFSDAVAAVLEIEPSLTVWQRLETHPVALDLAPGLEARIADPLWLVGRQWQFAELKGEDAGTPIRVELRGEQATLRFPAGSGRRDHPLGSADGLIEPLVEAEPARAAVLALGVEAGFDFEHALAAHGAEVLVPEFRRRFALSVGPVDASADPAGAKLLHVLRGRGLDATALAAALSATRDASGAVTALPEGIAGTPAVKKKALAAATEWLAMWDRLFIEPGDAAPYWRDARLEYSFGMQAEHSAGTTQLAVDEYGGGRLDWWSFDLGATSAADALAERREVHTVSLPMSVRYPGMPADRYWEFEDGAVNLADPKGGPAAITMMLALEYQLVASNDWFEVPVELPYGSAFRVEKLAVTDTFGIEANVPRASAGPAGWAMFELAARADAGASPQWFVLPSVTADTQESAPLEEVRLFRDEMANLVWGVERRVPGFTLEAAERSQESSAGQVVHQALPDAAQLDAATVYRLQTSVPRHWFPFTAEPDPAGPAGSVVLTRRSLRRLVADENGTVSETADRPAGRILAGTADGFSVEEREVPRSGIVVTRSLQYARTATGERVLWIGRSKRVGRGEGTSGLRYDVLEPVKHD